MNYWQDEKTGLFSSVKSRKPLKPAVIAEDRYGDAGYPETWIDMPSTSRVIYIIFGVSGAIFLGALTYVWFG